MILLFGGTSETSRIAEGLASAGLHVLVSCATAIDLDIGTHEKIRRRAGPLNVDSLLALIADEGVRLFIDATHPYATEARATAREAARQAGIPYLTYLRPAGNRQDEKTIYAADHEEAAHLVCTMGKPVLLTIGAKNIAPYAVQAKQKGIPLAVRVLPEPSSLDACRKNGIPEERIVAKRGPFSVEENRETIKRYDIGVMVTKESGAAGGFAEKIEAARIEDCTVIVVSRPPAPVEEETFDNIDELLRHVRDLARHLSLNHIRK